MARLSRILSAAARLLGRRDVSQGQPGSIRPGTARTETEEVRPSDVRGLTLSYEPDADGAPDGGEIVWTWVPYAERDGRGKDRPVLVLGRRDAQRVYALRLTSSSHDGDHDYLALGAGEWDASGRPSWADLSRLYSVHERGMRREAAALDVRRFQQVARALQQLYGWRETR